MSNPAIITQPTPGTGPRNHPLGPDVGNLRNPERNAMTPPFSIESQPLPADPQEQNPQAPARITISAAGVNLTRLKDTLESTTRDHLVTDAYVLAKWLAANYWRLLWETKDTNQDWHMSHSIPAAGHGYIWPDITLSSDWSYMTITSRRTPTPPDQHIIFLTDLSIQVPIEPFSKTVLRFIRETQNSATPAHNDLALLWKDLEQELSSADLTRHRILEACLRFDPDEGPSDLLEAMQTLEPAIGPQALREMAAANSTGTIQKVQDTLAYARDHGTRITIPHLTTLQGNQYHPDMADTVTRTRDKPESLLPETHPAITRRAAALAQAALREWNIQPPWTYQKMSDTFGIARRTLEGSDITAPGPCNAGLRQSGDPGNLNIVLSRRRPVSRRLHLARLAADHIDTDPGETLLPDTHADTARQQFQRAFAQELLCPAQVLLDHLSMEPHSADRAAPLNDRHITRAALTFGVPPVMIHSTLVRQGILPEESLLRGLS